MSTNILQNEFELTFNPARILFSIRAVSRTREMIVALGCKRALVLCTAEQIGQAQALAASLGESCAGIYSDATMHTPVTVTMDAIDFYEANNADCTIAIGGGSTTGLGKAINLRRKQAQIAIPTTYASSEVTHILGQTENNTKTTIRDASLQPDIVIYDPELTYGLPESMTITSGLNAIAHAIEALFAKVALGSDHKGLVWCWP